MVSYFDTAVRVSSEICFAKVNADMPIDHAILCRETRTVNEGLQIEI